MVTVLQGVLAVTHALIHRTTCALTPQVHIRTRNGLIYAMTYTYMLIHTVQHEMALVI